MACSGSNRRHVADPSSSCHRHPCHRTLRHDGADRGQRDTSAADFLSRGQHTGRGNRAGPKPLELYERRSAGAD